MSSLPWFRRFAWALRTGSGPRLGVSLAWHRGHGSQGGLGVQWARRAVGTRQVGSLDGGAPTPARASGPDPRGGRGVWGDMTRASEGGRSSPAASCAHRIGRFEFISGVIVPWYLWHFLIPEPMPENSPSTGARKHHCIHYAPSPVTGPVPSRGPHAGGTNQKPGDELSESQLWGLGGWGPGGALSRGPPSRDPGSRRTSQAEGIPPVPQADGGAGGMPGSWADPAPVGGESGSPRQERLGRDRAESRES